MNWTQHGGARVGSIAYEEKNLAGLTFRIEFNDFRCRFMKCSQLRDNFFSFRQKCFYLTPD